MSTNKVLAIASGGGHWQQLMRLLPALEAHELVFLTTNPSYADDVPSTQLYVIPDANRDRPLRLMQAAWEVMRHVRRLRPDVVISTGAAPGLFGVLFGRLVGARTIWVDSVANAEALSMSGRIAASVVELCLTQWDHLASPDGPRYEGSIL